MNEKRFYMIRAKRMFCKSPKYKITSNLEHRAIPINLQSRTKYLEFGPILRISPSPPCNNVVFQPIGHEITGTDSKLKKAKKL